MEGTLCSSTDACPASTPPCGSPAFTPPSSSTTTAMATARSSAATWRTGRCALSPASTSSATVGLTDVGFTFDGTARPTLAGVTFDVPAGSTVAIVGPTGSGKSTLAGLLVRLVDPSDGHVLLDGVDLRRLREGETSDQAAFVAQGTFLFDDTVRGNVTLDGPFTDDEVWTALRVAAADDFVAALPDGPRHPGRRARAPPSPAASASGWPWPGPSSAVRGCSSSTTRPAPSTRRSRPASSTRLRASDEPATVVVIAYRQATIALADEVVWLEHGRVARPRHPRGAARRRPRLRRPGPRLLPGGGGGVTDGDRRRRSDRTESALATLRRGLRMMPEFRRGLPATFALALIATAGRVVVPIAVQQVIDRGLRRRRPRPGPDHLAGRSPARSSSLITAVAVFRMNVRLFRTTETALAGLRVRAFRHVHDLSVLHQQGERRGSLVSRVTSDVDQLSVFMQWGGVLGLVSVGQLVVATVVMAFYSWQLTLLVLACFIPLGDRRPAGSPQRLADGLRRRPRAGRRRAGRRRRVRRRRADGARLRRPRPDGDPHRRRHRPALPRLGARPRR